MRPFYVFFRKAKQIIKYTKVMEATATKQNNFNIELYDIKNEDCLKFTFDGKFSEEQAISGASEWRQLFDNTGNEKSILVWDCLDMTGFESNARTVWLKAIKDLKKNIDCVWVISESKIVRAGAKVLSTLSGFKIKTVKSESEISLCRL